MIRVVRRLNIRERELPQVAAIVGVNGPQGVDSFDEHPALIVQGGRTAAMARGPMGTA